MAFMAFIRIYLFFNFFFFLILIQYIVFKTPSQVFSNQSELFIYIDYMKSTEVHIYYSVVNY